MKKSTVFGSLACLVSFVLSFVGLTEVMPKVMRVLVEVPYNAIVWSGAEPAINRVLNVTPLPIILVLMLIVGVLVVFLTILTLIAPMMAVHFMAVEKLFSHHTEKTVVA